MQIAQGEIYLVDFGVKYNSELGKIRPAVVVQNNFFNKTIEDKIYKQVLVAPLSTVVIEDDFRIKIEPRDRLEKRSYIISNWLCTLDIEHILTDRGLITQLNEDEFSKLKKAVCSLI